MKGKWDLVLIAFLLIAILSMNVLTSDKVDNLAYSETDALNSYGLYISEDDIRNKWREYSPKYKDKPYKVEPSTQYPYEKGRLEEEFIEDGVNMANFIRYLAGLPDDLETHYVLNNQAQYAAVLLAANQTLSHRPTQPRDMERSFYDIGYRAASKSNIASGIYTLSDTVIGYTMDFGDTNLENVGHRRWILNPKMKKIGFGYCEGYSAMSVLDETRDEIFDFDYITYPTEGNFPCNMFYADCCPYGSNPWSVILNHKKYDNTRISEIKIELKDLNNRDNSWNFCWKHYDSDCEKYFNVDTSSSGVPFCIIFRPDDVFDYEEGCQYKVKVTGLYTIYGEETEIEYTVNFFDLYKDNNKP